MYNAINHQPPTENSVHFDRSKNITYDGYPSEDSFKHSENKSLGSDKKDKRSSIGVTSTLGAISSSGLSSLYAPVFVKEEKKDVTKQSFSINYHMPTFESHPNPSFDNNYVFGGEKSQPVMNTVFSSQKPLDIPKFPEYKPF
jgi:hypothetical protein